MSGYRNYVPWKSSLPYKSGSGSTYSSRDDVNTSDVKTTPRFGSLASPAAYRPSYSGGTYRSVKRDTPLVSTPYVSRYGSSYSSAKDEKDTKPPETAKKIQPTQSKYLGSASNKENSLEPKISRYSTSTGNLAKYGTKSRDPSPAPDRRSNIAVTRAKSRDPSPVVDRRHTPSFSTSTSNLSKYGRRSRDPSPIADIRLSAASPARSNLRARSRDPSPVDSRFKGSVGSTSSSYGSTYRLGQRSSTNYGSKYGSGSPSISSTSRNNLSDKALSYMSVSDFRARSVSRTHDCTKKLEKLSLSEKESDRSARRARAEAISDLDNKISDHCENETKKVEVEPEVFVPVTVVTRGTSPTPPGASSFVRSRRTDLAKTIEKTIQRSSRKPSCSDKEIQSDRLDDSTRYSRFSSAGRMSSIPWSPYTETKFSRSDSSKYSGSSGSGKPVKSEVETVEKKKKDESSSKSSSSSTRSNTKQDKSKSSSELKSSKSSTKQFSTSSKQKSTESLANSSSRALPPAVPKVESPTKSMSSSSSSRWPNKDFRKSALNVGPTDRPRKSRTPSTGTDTEEKCDQAKAIGSPAFGRGERSPSVGSEASGVSTATATSSSSSASSSDEQKRCNRANGKTSPVVQLQSQPDPEDDESPSVAVPIENTGSYNKITSSGFGMRGDHQQQQQQQPNQPMLNFRQVQSPEYDSPVESPSAQLVAKNEEAKSFLIRKLGSVSNFFVNRTQDTSGETIYLDNSSGNSNSDGLKEDTTTASVSQLLSPTVAITSNTKTDSDLDESSWWQNTSQQINTESALDVRDDMKYKLRHIDSGEVAWWMQNENEDDTIADDLKTLNQQDDPDRSENTDRSCTNEQRSESREKSWWPTSNSGSATAAEKPPNRIRRIESGERAWWLNDNNSPDSPKEVSDPAQNQRLSAVNEDSTSEFQRGDPDPNQASNQYNVPWWMADNSQQEPEKVVSPFKVRPSQSGEKDWWLNNSSNESPSRDSIAQREYRYSIPAINKIRHVDSGEKAWWLQDESADSGGQVNDATETLAPEDEEIKRASSNYYYNNSTNNNHQEAALSQSDTRIPPLGDRASPEGLEDNSVDRKSPHRNTNHNDTNRNIPTKRNRSDKAFQLFISRHRNIDELLGGSCRPLSPLMNRFGGKDGFFEEISPNQVRIHDSTAQMPVIQRMERDEWDFVSTNQPYQQQSQHELDDAAVQVYKDGDYGAYLDLESSLAEQAEEIEGLDSSRKNSLVVRTQLSVRVHTIIEKLLSSEGSELRRALFSLKQIFQEDKDLVHGFVALGGLNCLVRVGNVADQNYQNYILRALGQVMLYVDGMNGVMRHSPTIQWLYSLIASKYRLVVKTALKLLLVFVEYVESNCNLLVLAVHAVDKTQGTLPWSNIMKLLKDYENADTELLIYATSLINKTLSGLSDQDSFYDESDFLEQQGMEGVIQRYMSRPGTDLDLLDQLQLYEAVLKFEDGETDGIRIPDNSVRKTLRLRANVDSTERRKSRRHSTGTSPSTQQNLASPKRYTPPTHGVLDEDSSSSNNSNEFSAGVFRECKGQREGAGVTPGLRRRRERAERQKSFMREQQEAAANGIRSPFDKNGEQNGLGQIVTAVPVHLRNGTDSPPDSLTARPEKSALNNSSDSCGPTANHVLYSPVKNSLSNTSISVISNGFEKKITNGIAMTNDRPSSVFLQQNGITGKRPTPTSDFVSNKNLVMRNNPAVISGLMKNIGRNENKNNILGMSDTNENTNASTNTSYTSHKKFENDSNRLNNYYNHLTSAKNNNITASVLNQKNMNGSENCNKFPVNCNSSNNNNNNNTSSNYSNGVVINTNSNNVRVVGKHKDMVTTSNSVSSCPPLNPESELINSQGNAVTNGSKKLCDGDSECEEKKLVLQIRRDHTVKDLTQKLTNLPTSPQEDKTQNRIGDMTGLISKAKEGLAKSKSKGDISRSPSVDQEIKKVETKKSENELHWEELVKSMSRPLTLCDLDFTDLNDEDEKDVLAPRGLGGAIPPPPPPIGIPPPISGMGPPFNGKLPPGMSFPPPPTNLVPPPGFGYASLNKQNGDNSNSSIKKNKKTVKLFWKEVREDMIPPTISKTIWDELPKATVDIQKLEHLFESRAKDLITKKQQELNKNKEIIVLDHKRSNAINIAMTKLPPPRAIKAAILKMDQTVVTREGIDKLLNMLPTDEERGKIQEAQMSNPELPLGSAEQFLLTLSSISELSARLKLWAFKLDFENTEKEIAEPLNDLKQGVELLKANKTFKCILSTLLSVGIFLNGAPVKGFQIEYLAKVPEVKDTVHKHSLLHHLCHMVMESSPDTTDLYSEIGPITRASKADFTDLAHNLAYLETECKASWDRLKLIAKHDCPPQLKQKLVDFLAECAERIIILEIIHRRVINRYRKFLLWLGVPQHRVAESRPNEFSRIVSEFALEYRTTRERVQQQIEKKANHRERNKTRGKMIIDIGKFRTQEDRADAELKQLLGSPNPRTENQDGILTWRRRRAENLRSPITKQNEESFTDGDDEILESLVKTATKAPGSRPTPRERKRTRHADRKSLKRSRTREGFTVERNAASPEH